jgi:putative membrane protein insertion efficiency factor
MPRDKVSAPDRAVSLPARFMIAMVRGYRFLVSPFFASRCRFQPSCSGYAVEALTRYGATKGAWLSIRRISRCHPWGSSGYDPVP